MPRHPLHSVYYRFQASSTGPRVATGAVLSCLCLACGLMALGLGCRGANREATAPARGTVALDGKPLPYGQVVFQPLNGRVARGVIENGEFTLGTYEAADGAVLGRHRVSVTARKVLEGEEPGAPGVPRFSPSLIPERYGNSATSGLEFEVVGGDNVFQIELSSRP